MPYEKGGFWGFLLLINHETSIKMKTGQGRLTAVASSFPKTPK